MARRFPLTAVVGARSGDGRFRTTVTTTVASPALPAAREPNERQRSVCEFHVFALSDFTYLVGHHIRHVPTPTLFNVHCDHPQWMPVLSEQQIANDGSSVRFRRVGLYVSETAAAKAAED